VLVKMPAAPGGPECRPKQFHSTREMGGGVLKCLTRSRHTRTQHTSITRKWLSSQGRCFSFPTSFRASHLCFPNLFSRSCNGHTSLIIQERCARASQAASRAWRARMPYQTVPLHWGNKAKVSSYVSNALTPHSHTAHRDH
jgi:hypothetical protein